MAPPDFEESPRAYKKTTIGVYGDFEEASRRLLAKHQREQLGLGPLPRTRTDRDRIAALRRGPGARSQSPRVSHQAGMAQFAPMPDNVARGDFSFGTATSSFGGFGNNNNNAATSEQDQGGEMDRIELTSPGPSNGNTNSFGGFGQQQQQSTTTINKSGSNTGTTSFGGFATSTSSQQASMPPRNSGSPVGGYLYSNMPPVSNGSPVGGRASNAPPRNSGTPFGGMTRPGASPAPIDGWSAFKSGSPAAQTNGNNPGASVFSNLAAPSTSKLNFSQTYNAPEARRDEDEDEEMDMGASPEKPTRGQQASLLSNLNITSNAHPGTHSYNSGSFWAGNPQPNAGFSQQTATSASHPFGTSPHNNTNNTSTMFNQVNQQTSVLPGGDLFSRITYPNGSSTPQQTVTPAPQRFSASPHNNNTTSLMLDQPEQEASGPPGGDLFSRMSQHEGSMTPQQTATSASQSFGASTPAIMHNNASTLFSQANQQGFMTPQQTATSASQSFGASTPATMRNNASTLFSQANQQGSMTPQQTATSASQSFGASTPTTKHNNASTLFSQANQQAPAPSGGDLFSRITFPDGSKTPRPAETPASKPFNGFTPSTAPAKSAFAGSSNLFGAPATPAAPATAFKPSATFQPSTSLFSQQAKAQAAQVQETPTASALFKPKQSDTQPSETAANPQSSTSFFAPATSMPNAPLPAAKQAEPVSSSSTASAATAPTVSLPETRDTQHQSIMSSAQLGQIRRLNEGFIRHLSRAGPHANHVKSFNFYKQRMSRITGKVGRPHTPKQPSQVDPATQPTLDTQSLFKPSQTAQQTPKAASVAGNLFSSAFQAPATEPSKKRGAQDVATATLKRRKTNDQDERPDLTAGASDTSKMFGAVLGTSASGQGATTEPAAPATGFTPAVSAKPTASAGFMPSSGSAKPANTSSFLSSFGQTAKKQEDEARKKAMDEDFDSEDDDLDEWNKKYDEAQARKKAEFGAVAAGGFKPTAPVSAASTDGFKPTASAPAASFGGFKPTTPAPAASFGGFKPTTPASAASFGGFKPTTSSAAPSTGFKPAAPSASSGGVEPSTQAASKKRRGPFEEDDDDDEGQKWHNTNAAAATAKPTVKASTADADDGDDEDNESESERASGDEWQQEEEEAADPHEGDEFNVADNEDVSAANSKTDDDKPESVQGSGFEPPSSYDSPFLKHGRKLSPAAPPTLTPFKGTTTQGTQGESSIFANSAFKTSTSFSPFKGFGQQESEPAVATPGKDQQNDGTVTPYAKSIFAPSTSSNIFGGANFSPSEATPVKATPFGKGGLGQSTFGQSQQSQLGQSLFGKSTTSNLFGGTQTPTAGGHTWQNPSPIKYRGADQDTDITPGRTTQLGASTNSNFANMPTPKNAPGEWPHRPGMARPLDAEQNQADNATGENDEDATNDPQVENMTALLPSESEESDVLYHVEKAKAFKFEIKGGATTKTWNEKTLGPIWLLKNKTTGKVRVLLKIPPFGKPGMNFNLMTSADMYKSAGKRVMASFVDHIHEKEAKAPSQWYIQFGKEADATEMGRLMKEQAGQQ